LLHVLVLLIRDAELLDWLEANMGRILARDPEAIAHAVERSCINKVRNVIISSIHIKPYLQRHWPSVVGGPLFCACG
jgi:hypothetical protein